MEKESKTTGEPTSYLKIIIVMIQATFSTWITWFQLSRKEVYVRQTL